MAGTISYPLITCPSGAVAVGGREEGSTHAMALRAKGLVKRSSDAALLPPEDEIVSVAVTVVSTTVA